MKLFRNVKQNEIENIQINHALVFLDYGETTQVELGITKGGAEFVVTEEVRQIEHDGARGKEKGLMLVDTVNASLKVPVLQLSHDYLMLTLSAAEEIVTGDENNQVKHIKSTAGGVIADSHYRKNVTAFCRKLNGKACKIVIQNPSNESGLTFTTEDKGEGSIELFLEGHWDPKDYGNGLYEIYDNVELPE